MRTVSLPCLTGQERRARAAGVSAPSLWVQKCQGLGAPAPDWLCPRHPRLPPSRSPSHLPSFSPGPGAPQVRPSTQLAWAVATGDRRGWLPLHLSPFMFASLRHTRVPVCVCVMPGHWRSEDPDVELCEPGVGVVAPALSWQVVFSRELRVLQGFQVSPKRGVCTCVCTCECECVCAHTHSQGAP